MIPLSLAEVADAGRRHADRRARPDAAVDRRGRPRLPHRRPRRPVRRARGGAGRRARLPRRRPPRPAPSGRWPAGRTTRCRASWSPTRSCPGPAGRAACTPGSTAGGLSTLGDHRLVGQDLDQGPARPGARRGRAHGEPARLVQQRHRPAAHGARADESTRYLVLEMGARGTGHIARLCRRRPAADRRGAQRRHRRTWASSAAPRASPRPRASSSRRCPAGRHRRPQRRRPAGARHGHRAPRPACVTTGRAADADVRAVGVSLDDARPRPRSPWSPPARSTRSPLRVVGEHQVANALSAAARRAGASGMPAAEVAAALSAAGPLQPLADGGHRSAPTA